MHQLREHQDIDRALDALRRADEALDPWDSVPPGRHSMSRQGDLFRPMCAAHHGHQGDLFPDQTDAETALHCEQCGCYLVHTPSGYLACPGGHGKLRLDVPSEPSGLCFPDEPGE
jgi:hypothetical protein